MKRLLVPTALALALGFTGTAWADCGSHSQTKQSTAEAPVEKPAPSPSS